MEKRWLVMYFSSFFTGISNQGQNFNISLRQLRVNFISGNQEVAYMRNEWPIAGAFGQEKSNPVAGTLLMGIIFPF